MEWTAVTSSEIAEVGYESENEVLGIRFKTSSERKGKPNKDGETRAEYHYANVDPTLHTAILNSDSVGRAFAAYIKAYPTKYPYKKIEPVVTEDQRIFGASGEFTPDPGN